MEICIICVYVDIHRGIFFPMFIFIFLLFFFCITIQALEQAAIGSGLKELQERLNTEVSKRESAERVLASVQVYSKPCAFFVKKMHACIHCAHTLGTHTLNTIWDICLA